jgi:rSAM/selenodomain-associated transferase 2
VTAGGAAAEGAHGGEGAVGPRGAPAVLVMARAPEPGRVKTRLQPDFSPEECAEIQRVLVRRTARWAVAVAGVAGDVGAAAGGEAGPASGGPARGGPASGGPSAAYVAHHPPQGWGELRGLVPPGVEAIPQRGDHLGERLTNAVAEVFDRIPPDETRPLLVVGVDTKLTPQHAADALDRLDAGADVVFGPALDGGYYLVAMKRPQPAVFGLPPEGWGGPDVLARSLAAAHAAGLSTALLRPERDLDTPADALALTEGDSDPELAALLRRSPRVSVVIPTRNEATALPQTLDHLARLPGRFEVTVVDGGSEDHTRQIAANHPLEPQVLHRQGGRAAQLNEGARASTGDPIVFLHADTRLPQTAYESLTTTPAAGGNFAIRFDGNDLFSRVLGAWYRVQRRLGVYYGDSAIWLTRDTFERLGGFDTSLPIMDDYELVRRLERHHTTTCLPGPATTSARRWRALGVPRTVLSWLVIRWLYLAGVPPERLARLYRSARATPGSGT